MPVQTSFDTGSIETILIGLGAAKGISGIHSCFKRPIRERYGDVGARSDDSGPVRLHVEAHEDIGAQIYDRQDWRHSIADCLKRFLGARDYDSIRSDYLACRCDHEVREAADEIAHRRYAVLEVWRFHADEADFIDWYGSVVVVEYRAAGTSSTRAPYDAYGSLAIDQVSYRRKGIAARQRISRVRRPFDELQLR